jgi:hypothetical protein
MGRWAHLDTDEERLPEGMIRIGYDADRQVYTYRDRHDQSIWEGAPGCKYGRLHQISRGAPRLPSVFIDAVEGEEPDYVLHDPDIDDFLAGADPSPQSPISPVGADLSPQTTTSTRGEGLSRQTTSTSRGEGLSRQTTSASRPEEPPTQVATARRVADIFRIPRKPLRVATSPLPPPYSEKPLPNVPGSADQTSDPETWLVTDGNGIRRDGEAESRAARRSRRKTDLDVRQDPEQPPRDEKRRPLEQSPQQQSSDSAILSRFGNYIHDGPAGESEAISRHDQSEPRRPSTEKPALTEKEAQHGSQDAPSETHFHREKRQEQRRRQQEEAERTRFGESDSAILSRFANYIRTGPAGESESFSQRMSRAASVRSTGISDHLGRRTSTSKT